MPSSAKYLLDTSAILTLIEDEAGADRVEEVLRSGEVILPWLSLLETHYVTAQRRGRPEADRRYGFLSQLPATILWETGETVVLTAARLKAIFRLSLADAIVAAYARTNNAILVHKDPDFEALSGELTLEALPFKPQRA